MGEQCNLKEEFSSFGSPPGEPGSPERTKYFEEWVGNLPQVESKVSDEARRRRLRKEEVLPFTMVPGKKAGVMAKIDNPVAANLKENGTIELDASKPCTK